MPILMQTSAWKKAFNQKTLQAREHPEYNYIIQALRNCFLSPVYQERTRYNVDSRTGCVLLTWHENRANREVRIICVRK